MSCIVLASCASNGDVSTPSGEPVAESTTLSDQGDGVTTTGATADLQPNTYDDTSQLIAASGLRCDVDATKVAEPAIGSDITHCTDDVVAITYDLGDAASIERHLASSSEIASVLRSVSTSAIGPNWTVTCSEDPTPCTKVAEATGADLRTADFSPVAGPPTGSNAFVDVIALREAMADIGFDCTSYTPESIQGIGKTTDAGQCDPIGYLSTYRDRVEAEFGYERGQAITDVTGTRHYVIGPNWLVDCGSDAGVCPDIADGLDAEYRIQQPS